MVQDTFLIQFEDISSFDEDVTVEEGSNIEDIIGLMCGEAVTVNFVVIDGCERATNCSSVMTIQDTMAPIQDPCPEPLIINAVDDNTRAVSYTHLRAHETEADLVCRLLLEKKKN